MHDSDRPQVFDGEDFADYDLWEPTRSGHLLGCSMGMGNIDDGQAGRRLFFSFFSYLGLGSLIDDDTSLFG